MEEFFKMLQRIGKAIITCMGGIMAFLKPTIPFMLICMIAILCDCYTAWTLSRRVKKKFPGSNDGKFKSVYFGKVIMTMIKVCALIVLAFCIDKYIFPDINVRLANIVAGAVCFWQIWSMLENESSCNNAKWAKIAQKILVDKTERHFDIDLSDLKAKEQDQTPKEEIDGKS